MKQKLKKIISIVLIICMTVTIFPAEGFVDASTSDNEISDTSGNESEAILEGSQDMEEYLRENNEGEDLYRLVVDADDNVSNIEDILDDTAGVTDYILTEDECVIEFETQEDLDVAKDNLDNTDGDTNYWEDEIISDALFTDESWETELTGLSDAKKEYEASYDNNGIITVAIIDSGIDESNSLFSDRISNYSITYDGAELADSLGHGTGVAGIIAESTPSNVELLIIDAFDENGNTTLYTIKSAITYAIECGADIINMSWGFTVSEESEDKFDDLIKQAENAGIIMVTSAGNNSSNVKNTYPANRSEVITVSSINSDLEVSSFSNYGSTVDFCAPGENIYTIYGSTMKCVSGTSFSAPFVSAVAAYMLLLDLPVYDTLIEYAVDICDEGWDKQTGYGYIDLSDFFTSPGNETTEKTVEETTENIIEGTTEETIASTEESEDESINDDPSYGRLSGKYIDSGFGDSASLFSTYTHASKFDGYTVKNGIDVSSYQGTIDWDAVAADGVEFAIIRVGYRGYGSSGSLNLDSNAKTNIKGALAAGIQVGVYFFSQAITTAEAEAEAAYVLDYLDDIGVDSSDITLPVVMDFEYASTSSGDTGRLYNANLTQTQATNICLAFLKKIEQNGYSAMLYANKSMLESGLNASTISASYDIWLAHYTTSTSYSGDYTFWQYSSAGTVDGISGNVDLDFWYYPGSLDTPVLNDSTTAANNGVKVSWSKVSGASGYTVYRKKSGGSWSLIGNTTSTSYTDTTATAGTTYYYTVRAYSGTLTIANKHKYSSGYWSGYDKTGVSGKYIKMPTIKWASAENSGTKLTWDAISGATGYAIWRKTSSTSWTRIANVSSSTTSYTDTSSRTSGTTYYYTIRAYSGDLDTANSNCFNSLYWSYYDTTGRKTVYLSIPSLDSETIAANNGIKVSWSKVSGASGYAVYRKVSGGSWSIIGNTVSTSYTDTTATAGTTYYYTVRAYTGTYSTAKSSMYNAAYWSGFDSTTVSGKYIEMPTIKWASAENSGTKLTWNSVSGATGYAIWRKTSSTSWTRIANVSSSTTSYTDTSSLTSGTTYYYTIRAYSGDLDTANSNRFNSLYWSYYDTTGRKTVYLSIPSLDSKTIAANNGIKVSWSKVSGASGYAVYRKVSGGSWSIIGNTVSTSYTDTTATAGTTYYYTVRAYTGTYSTAKSSMYNAAYWSGFDSTTVSGKYIEMPTIKWASAENSGTKLTWNSVSGATGYVIWRKTSSTSWTRVGTTTGTSYTDTSSRTSGTTYYYTIRAYSGDINTANSNTFNSNYWSYYDTTGTKTVYLSNPVLSSTTAASGGIKISWGKVSGASGYTVFRKTSGGSWTIIGNTTSTNYTDTTASAGTTYYYTVRAYTGTYATVSKYKYNALYWSGYDSTGIKY